MKNTKFIFVALWAAILVAMPLSSADAYNYTGRRWGGTNPQARINTTKLYLTSYINTANAVMGEWNYTGARLTFTSDSNSSSRAFSYYNDVNRILAYAKVYTYPFTKTIYKADMGINNYHNFNPPYKSGTYYDLKSVMRHELGHWLQLDHVSSSSALMYAYLAPAQVKYITTDEINGIRAIYGRR